PSRRTRPLIPAPSARTKAPGKERVARSQASESVSVDAAKEAVTPVLIACEATLRIRPSPVDVVFTLTLNVSVVTPATVSSPAHEPPVVGNVPPYSPPLATTESPLEKPCAGLDSTPGEALVQVNGSQLKFPM